jgi:cysteine desulfurase/selenocysteine lyase
MAHAVGARVLIDGCQGAVHAAPDVQAIGCDFYVITGHKLYGPTGIGALYGTAEGLDSLPPYQGGGEMIDTVTMDEVRYAPPPHRFEAGTPPILEAIGLGAAIDWLSSLDRRAVLKHEHDLLARVEERVNGANWLKRYGTAPWHPSTSISAPAAWAISAMAFTGLIVPSTLDMWVQATMRVRGPIRLCR